MGVRVVDREPFDRRGDIQLAVGRDQCDRPEADGLVEPAHFEGCG